MSAEVCMLILIFFNAGAMIAAMYFVGKLAHSSGYSLAKTRVYQLGQKVNEAIEDLGDNESHAYEIKGEWRAFIRAMDPDTDRAPDYWVEVFKFMKGGFK